MSKASNRISRGYYGIGIERTKTATNVGSLWRSALCFDADFIFTIGRRYSAQCSDTVRAPRHIPLWHFDDAEDFLCHRPHDCQLVGVEITPAAKALERFSHPERAIYLLGPEDGSLSPAIVGKCQHIVKFDTRFCINVACAGTVVMYDRAMKSHG